MDFSKGYHPHPHSTLNVLGDGQLNFCVFLGYDRFLPVSNKISTAMIPDPHDVRLQLQVNGQVMQDDNTNLMIFKIPELLEAITDVMTLESGDIVLSNPPLSPSLFYFFFFLFLSCSFVCLCMLIAFV